MKNTEILGCALAVGLFAPSVHADESATGKDRKLAVFAGQMTFDDYGTIAYDPGNIDWADSHLAGLAYSQKWRDISQRFTLGWEVQLIGHTGINDHVELNIPVWIRYNPIDPWFPFQSAGFGVGPSFASSPPELEIERKGQSQRAMPTWFMELEFGDPDWVVSPFIRIHHRSDGYIFADFDTGSNGVVAGVRFSF
ncbi:MAG: hypothetical protein AAGF71_04540 [Pseudomonadota bacterium]